MTTIDVETIRPGVRAMLEVNMGLAPGERLLVVTDVPTPVQWAEWPVPQLLDMSRRSALARLVAEIGAEEFPACRADFFAYPATGRSGSEPGAETAARLQQAEVVVAITSFSLSHTEARENACRAGARVASMPRFQAEMFYPGGAMAVDYHRVAEETARIATLLTTARTATVRCSAGTDVTFSLEGRLGQADDGLYTRPGAWGNLPAGEAYIAPLEGTGTGVLVVQAGWHPGLACELRLVFERGEVVAVEGEGDVGQHLRQLLGLGRAPRRELTSGRACRPGSACCPDPDARARRNLAELGIGTNPNARRTDITLEAEKIRGTVHLAIGDNSHMGGQTVADFHMDFVIPRATLLLDGRVVMQHGTWLAD
ncbi:MAG: hypothetical protein AB1503_02285 [Bacillota bacterium]